MSLHFVNFWLFCQSLSLSVSISLSLSRARALFLSLSLFSYLCHHISSYLLSSDSWACYPRTSFSNSLCEQWLVMETECKATAMMPWWKKQHKRYRSWLDLPLLTSKRYVHSTIRKWCSCWSSDKRTYCAAVYSLIRCDVLPSIDDTYWFSRISIFRSKSWICGSTQPWS